MKTQLSNYIDSLISFILVILIALTPLVFSSLTTNFFDIPKLIILSVGSLVLLGLWTFSSILKGKIEIVRTPLDLPLLFLLFTVVISAFFSTSKYSSIYGVFPDIHGSLISWVAYIVFYFLAASHFRKNGQVKILLQALFISVFLVSLVSLLSYFKIFLPFEISRSVNFSTTGSTFSAVAFLLLLLPLSLVFSATNNKIIARPFALTLTILIGLTVVLVGTALHYILLFSIFAVCLLVLKTHLTAKNLPLLLSPIALSFLVLMLLNIPFSGNILHDLRNNFPQEIQLPVSVSWKISASSFRDAPIFGTGPSTYLYNFTSYKPAEFNQLKFWNFSFGSAHDEYLQALATLGILGFVALIILTAVIAFYSKRHLVQRHLDGVSVETRILLHGLALSGFTAIALLLIHATSLVSLLITLILVSLLMTVPNGDNEKVSEISTGIKLSLSGKQVDIFPVIIFVLYLVVLIFLLPKMGSAIMADYYHRLALGQASKDGAKTYENLQKAERLNPYIDLYRVDMAQTNFALANALASQKGPTDKNPQGTLTDQDKLTIQTLVTQAINEGRASVALSPRSSRNWEILALIYRNITGVAKNSLTFALDAYGRSIQMDPLNPLLRINVGSIYHSTKNYDLAVRFYTDAVNLKPDYVNGYYNLALALRDKGDFENARLIAEQAASLMQKDMGTREYISSSKDIKETKVKDFKIVNDLLAEIKTKVGTDSTNQSGPLQNPNLPSIEVPSLNNPPVTVSPPVVQENPQANLPGLSPSVTVSPAP